MTEDTDRKWHESPEYRQEQLSAALDGALTANEQAALDAHLAGCESCRSELEDLRQVRALLRALPEPALPRSFLLPTEGELAAPRAPARARGIPPVADIAGEAQVTPLRPRDRREYPSRRAIRTLGVTRWIGTIAAVLGLALFLGTLLPMMATHPNSNASTSAPQYSANGAATTDKSATGAAGAAPTRSPVPSKSIDQYATATAAAAIPSPNSHTPTDTAAQQEYGSPAGPSSADILRMVALVLFFAGAALAIVSFIAARVL